jgi:Domain of unknown function (DUF4436)
MKINVSHGASKRILILATLFIMVILIIPFFITSSVKSTVDKELSPSNKRTDYSFDISLAKIDIPQNLATLTMTPRFSGKAGESTRNGSLSYQDVELLVDSFQGNSSFSAEIGQLLGRQEFDVLLRGNSWRYPFDNYSASVSLWDSLLSEDPNMSIVENNEYLPGFITRSTTVPGYDDYIYGKGFSKSEKVRFDLKRGQVTVKWDIQRLPGDIYAAILLAILMIISALASISVSRAVWSGTRPPSINTLAWLAAFLFAMFQIRASLPGNPANGNLFDFIVFYPILVVLLVEMAVVVYLWIRRDDWDLKNIPDVSKPESISE